MTVDDEITMLAADIRRYCNNDGRIDEALDMLCKLYQAEVDALAFEAAELERLIVRDTTAREAARIAASEPEVRWVERRHDVGLGARGPVS